MVEEENLFKKLDFFISLRGMSPCSPLVSVHEWDAKSKSWHQVNQTIVKENDQNPDFPPLRMVYYFEKA